MTFVSISLVDPVSGTVVPILPRACISVNTLDIAASARAIELDRVDGHGTYDITRWLGSAAVSLTMQLWDDADSGQTAAGFWDELSMLLSPNLRPVLLCDNDAWDAPRQITLRFDSDTKPLSDPTVWPVQVSWKAPMAMWEAAVPAEYFINATIAGVTGLLFTSSGLIFAPAAGIVFTGTAQTAEAIVTNGAFDTQWQARLYGPCSGPVLGNDSAGQALVFQSGLTIAAGDYVYCDSLLQTAKRASDGLDVTSYLDFVNSDWWLLQPGSNLLRYSPATVSAGSVADLTFRPTWKA